MTKPIRIGLIGSGGMGGRHALNLARQVAAAEVAVIMDRDRARAEAVATTCGGARVVDDARALIADPTVDAVVIASPDPTHAELALACLAAGKPALCEKPLATSLAEAEQVVRAEAALGRRLIQLGFMRVYDPAHRALKDAIERGAIGRPLLFRGLHSNLDAGLRTALDVIRNSAVHDFHSARWLLGAEVERVHAGHVPAVAERPDSCRLLLAHLSFANGALGCIEVSADSGYGYEVAVAITGEQGMASTGVQPEPVLRSRGQRFQAVPPDWLVRFEQAYVIEVQAWIGSLVAGRPVGPSAWDGYISLAVAEACAQALAAGTPMPVQAIARPALYDA
jgi:myo-inositol 2-dehydrogenase/D-chiro-inositol 1-dehydrogenase